MNQKQYSERKFVLGAIFIAVVLIFIARLFYIQVIEKKYKLEADLQSLKTVIDYPARGNIFDRKGKRLVYNQPAYDLMVTPNEVKDADTLELCRLLGIDTDEFIRRMRKASLAPNAPWKASIFAKEISVENSAALQEKLYKYPGFYVQPRTLRKYPMSIAAHLLGYIGEVSPEITDTSKYYLEGDFIGISGIERAYEVPLRGKRGVRKYMRDVLNRDMGSYMNGKYDTAAIAGKDLVCTLDADLQAYGEKLMQNKIGSIVAIEPSTGEILCMVSSPSYDPNLFVGSVRSQNYLMLKKDSIGKPLFNRALMASYPPGSTFKMVMALVGQNEQVLFPQTAYSCPGGYNYGGKKPLKCDAIHGTLSLEPAIARSCNTYFCNVFRSVMDNHRKYKNIEESFEAWRDYVTSFGIGVKLYSDIPNELRGTLPSIAGYNKIFGEHRWHTSSIISLAIGQGELGITPLQNANVVCIIANKGYYYIPHIVKSIGEVPNDSLLQRFKEKHYAQVIDSTYYNILQSGMSQVVEAGTAAASKIPGIDYCGKTGTAENKRVINGKVVQLKDHSMFIAFAPKDNPKIAIAVAVENAGWGAQWAAPIASLMIEKYLKGAITRPEIEQRMLEGNFLNQNLIQVK